MVFVNTGTKTPDGKLQATNSRKLLWDEENRLLSVSDNGFVSNYWYDAAGERTVKESGDNEGVLVNGVLSGARTGTTNFTAYISPYLVLTNGGNYTKHIYMGSQRIVSKLSNSSLFDGENPVDADKAMINDFTKKYNKQTDCLKARYDSLGVSFNGTLYKNMSNPAADALGGGTTMTPLKYYSHSDHLGSSSLITDASGGLVQHLEYVPFGEVFIDERPSQSSWSTPYKFNGKELDEETGLYYYGARYMDPRTSIWISVDPLWEKYIQFGSYVYCLDNPVRLIDPDGRGSKESGGNPATKMKNGVYSSAQSTIRTVQSEKQKPIKIPEGEESRVRYLSKEKNPFVLAFTTGSGGCHSANQETPSQWTAQDKAVASSTIGVITSLTGIGEMVAAGAGIRTLAIPFLGLLNSADGMNTNPAGESTTQQMVSSPEAKAKIGFIKAGISTLTLSSSIATPKMTFSSPVQTAGVINDSYGLFDFISTQAKPASDLIIKTNPHKQQHVRQNHR